MQLRTKTTALFMSVFMVLLSVSLNAAMLKVDVADLTKASSLVVTGKVIQVESFWTAEKDFIYTRATLAVDQVIKGVYYREFLQLEYDGGVVGEIGLQMSDMVHINPAEDVLLFLKKGKSRRGGKVYQIIERAQGIYTLGENGQAVSGSYAAVEGEEIYAVHHEVVSLDDLLMEIVGAREARQVHKTRSVDRIV